MSTTVAANAATVVDMAGRTVSIPERPKRILLGVGLDLPALSIIDPEIVSRLVAIGTDLERFDASTYRIYAEQFPALTAVTRTATGMGGVTSIEQALAVRPDLAIFALWQRARVEPYLAVFEKVGVAVVFIDFFLQPIRNTPRSMALLGSVLGEEGRAEAYNRFYADRLERVSQRVKSARGEKPRVYFEALYHPLFCCTSAGSDSFGVLLDYLGVDNLGISLLGSRGGSLGLEEMITLRPEIYVTSGASTDLRGGQLAMGPGIAMEQARASLLELAASPRVRSTPAAQSGNIHVLWNFFNGSPLNVPAIEAMATWFYPDLFDDLDPQETLAEIDRRFLPVRLSGTYWLTMVGGRGSQSGSIEDPVAK